MDLLDFLLGDSPVAVVAIFGAIGTFALLIWVTGLLGSFSVVLPVTIGLVLVAGVLSVLAWRRRAKRSSN